MKAPKEIHNLAQLVEVLQKTLAEKRYLFIMDHFDRVIEACLKADKKNIDATFAVFKSSKAHIDLATKILNESSLKGMDADLQHNVLKKIEHALQSKLKDLPKEERKEYADTILKTLPMAQRSTLKALIPTLLKQAQSQKPNLFDQPALTSQTNNDLSPPSSVSTKPKL